MERSEHKSVAEILHFVQNRPSPSLKAEDEFNT